MRAVALIACRLLSLFHVAFCEQAEVLDRQLTPLQGRCFTWHRVEHWWTYKWCHRRGTTQYHIDASGESTDFVNLGTFSGSSSVDWSNGIEELVYHFQHGDSCTVPGASGTVWDLMVKQRKTEVRVRCCSVLDAQERHNAQPPRSSTQIDDVNEPDRCSYTVTVCTKHLCPQALPSAATTDSDSDSAASQQHGGVARGGTDLHGQAAAMSRPRAELNQPRAKAVGELGAVLSKRSGSGRRLAGGVKGDKGGGQEAHTEAAPADADLYAMFNLKYEAGAGNVTARVMTRDERLRLRERARAMFTHGYDGYMRYAYPAGELRPLSCSGGEFELCKLPQVTLIDAMDTLAVMGNHTEFRRAVALVSAMGAFDFDVNVSVFETTIRILGGLLSAHLLATDPRLGIYNRTVPLEGTPLSPQQQQQQRCEQHATVTDETDACTGHASEELPAALTHDDLPSCESSEKGQGGLENDPESSEAASGGYVYRGELLRLAMDLGDRLLPAFDTETGIPYGTVNLLEGVPAGEIEEASLAGAGTLTLEMTALSALSGRQEYGQAAHRAVLALHGSYYEYLLKMYELWGEQQYWDMFMVSFTAIQRFLKQGDWFADADPRSGAARRYRMESLMAFWPGVLVSLGDLPGAARSLNTFYKVWRDFGFLPEEFDYLTWQVPGPGSPGMGSQQSAIYALRPELIESTLVMYRATKDHSWLWAGVQFIESIEEHCRTSCGYATVSHVPSKRLSDEMPSYFLAETAKYLFLLFDEDNFIHKDAYVFTTEAHPLHIGAIRAGGFPPSPSAQPPLPLPRRDQQPFAKNEKRPPSGEHNPLQLLQRLGTMLADYMKNRLKPHNADGEYPAMIKPLESFKEVFGEEGVCRGPLGSLLNEWGEGEQEGDVCLLRDLMYQTVYGAAGALTPQVQQELDMIELNFNAYAAMQCPVPPPPLLPPATRYSMDFQDHIAPGVLRFAPLPPAQTSSDSRPAPFEATNDSTPAYGGSGDTPAAVAGDGGDQQQAYLRLALSGYAARVGAQATGHVHPAESTTIYQIVTMELDKSYLLMSTATGHCLRIDKVSTESDFVQQLALGFHPNAPASIFRAHASAATLAQWLVATQASGVVAHENGPIRYCTVAVDPQLPSTYPSTPPQQHFPCSLATFGPQPFSAQLGGHDELGASSAEFGTVGGQLMEALGGSGCPITSWSAAQWLLCRQRSWLNCLNATTTADSSSDRSATRLLALLPPSQLPYSGKVVVASDGSCPWVHKAHTAAALGAAALIVVTAKHGLAVMTGGSRERRGKRIQRKRHVSTAAAGASALTATSPYAVNVHAEGDSITILAEWSFGLFMSRERSEQGDDKPPWQMQLFEVQRREGG
ncbi:hypothetical protein JKP88DRAFT_261708 [Tribonema minus]|uniref:alpha-1,2-Mannosidase n=1 Tax=Tribonema minus TaxID=303371 RepID=A0A835ZFD6_9STRA|nr:hypothetical protein JKP88DRAFT_261708 [Tribonema minus]